MRGVGGGAKERAAVVDIVVILNCTAYLLISCCFFSFCLFDFDIILMQTASVRPR